MARPRIAIPGRFTESASALRYRGVVTARMLMELVWQAGGDPVVLLPVGSPDGTDWSTRLQGFQGVLLPGGGDINPNRYGQPADHPALYDIDEVQDEADFTLARYALENEVPLLAICRGLHVVNVALGGSLIIDMPNYHRHHIHDVQLNDPKNFLNLDSKKITASCYHHQAIDQLGAGITVLGKSEDGYVEAIAIEAKAWAAGLQWHPEDTFNQDADQLKPVERLIQEAKKN